MKNPNLNSRDELLAKSRRHFAAFAASGLVLTAGLASSAALAVPGSASSPSTDKAEGPSGASDTGGKPTNSGVTASVAAPKKPKPIRSPTMIQATLAPKAPTHRAQASATPSALARTKVPTPAPAPVPTPKPKPVPQPTVQTAAPVGTHGSTNAS